MLSYGWTYPATANLLRFPSSSFSLRYCQEGSQEEKCHQDLLEKKVKGGFLRSVSKEKKIERFTLRSQFERLSPWTRLRGRRIMRKRWRGIIAPISTSLALMGTRLIRWWIMHKRWWWNNCPNLLQTFVIVSNFRDFRLSETSWRRDTVGDTIGILFVKKV